MPRRLKDLVVTRGSLVDEPANKHAQVMIFKHADLEAVEKMIKEEGGKFVVYSADGKKKLGSYDTKAEAQQRLKQVEAFKAAGDNPADWAYVPDKDHPSTWKLDISDAAHVGGAVAALGPGYRGQKVSIPPSALAGVKAKVRAAWKKFHPDAKPEEMPAVLKSTRDDFAAAFAPFFKDYMPSSPAMVGDAEPQTFGAVAADDEADDVFEDACDTLQQFNESLQSIWNSDLAADEKSQMLNQSWTEFTAAFADVLAGTGPEDEGNGADATMKSGRKISGTRMQRLRAAMNHLRSVIAEGRYVPPPKEETPMTKIDKSKLPADVAAYIGELEARAGIKPVADPDPKDVLKGLSPEARAVVEKAQADAASAMKRAEEAEKLAKAIEDERRTREFIEKAASLNAIPGDRAELAVVLKSAADQMKAEDYAKVEALFKATDATIREMRVIGGEIGSIAAGTIPLGGASTSLGKIKALATEMQSAIAKSGQTTTYDECVDKVLQMNPELYADYQRERRAAAH